MPTRRSWWLIPALAVFAVALMAAVLTPWVADRVEDAAVTALDQEGLGRVEFLSIDGVDGFGTAGAVVTLQGPAEDRAVAIAAVQATDEIGRVTYRLTPADGGGHGEAGGSGS